jgi:hypothetical protein
MSNNEVRDLGAVRRQQRLEALVALQTKRRSLPAERLVVEVDGCVIDDFVPDVQAREVALPAGALIVALRDEMGTPRAVLVPYEETLDNASFDDGRLFVSVSDASGSPILTLRAADAAVGLAAASEANDPTADEGDLVLRFTEDGAPEIDEDGYLVFEAFCDPRHAGCRARVSVPGVDAFEETISPEGFVRVVRLAPGLAEQKLRETDVVIRLTGIDLR